MKLGEKIREGGPGVIKVQCASRGEVGEKKKGKKLMRKGAKRFQPAVKSNIINGKIQYNG